jgi:hypothetical protein
MTDRKKSGMAYQIAAVAEVVRLAVTKGWTSIELIAGTSSMQRLLWIESKRYPSLTLKGYEPSDSDQKCLERLKKRAEDSGLIWEKQIQKNPTDELISISGAS